MYFTLMLVSLVFVFCSCDESIYRDLSKPNKNTPTGLEILSKDPCGLDISIIGLSPQCEHDFNLYTEAICDPHIRPDPDKNQTSIFDNFWAYKMLDATGKFPDGILEGNFNALGSYSSCLEIEATPKYGPPFSGKYGGARFKHKSRPFTLLYGVCFPSSCIDTDFYRILYSIDGKFRNDDIEYIWIPHFSVAHETYKLEGGDILMILFLAFFKENKIARVKT